MSGVGTDAGGSCAGALGQERGSGCSSDSAGERFRCESRDQRKGEHVGTARVTPTPPRAAQRDVLSTQNFAGVAAPGCKGTGECRLHPGLHAGRRILGIPSVPGWGAAVTKHPRLGGLQEGKFILSQFWGPGVQG